MSVPGAPDRAPSRPRGPVAPSLVVVAVLLTSALLALWPVVERGAPGGFAVVDGALQAAAGTGLAAAALLAAAGTGGRTRAAWVLLGLGATALACAQSVRLGAAAAAVDPSLPVGIGQAALAALATGTVLLLLLEARPPDRTLRWLDVALAITAAGLLAWVGGPVLAGQAPATGETVRLAGASALLGVSLLALVHPNVRPSRRPAGDRPDGDDLDAGDREAAAAWLLPVGLALLATSMLLAVTGDLSEELGLLRPASATGVAGLLLAAAGAVWSLRPGAGRAGSGDEPEAASALLVPAFVLPGALLLLGAALTGARIDTVGPVLLAAAVALALLRSQLLLNAGLERAARLAEDQARWQHQAFHDPLTGLANRQLLTDRLEHALAVHRRSGRSLALLFCDLDGFKAVNDAHGHDGGDTVLRTAAERLSECLRPTDTAARLGGDEFAILLDDSDHPEVVVGRLRARAREPIQLPGGSIQVGMSIGTAVVAAHDRTPDAQELLRRADAAMYEGKRRARAVTNDPAPAPPAVSPPDVHGADPAAFLRAALVDDLAAGRLKVVYQPVVHPATGVVAGLEALARWDFAGVPVPPPTFVRLAGQAGRAAALTDLVLERAATQLRRWSDALGHDRLTISVNVTPAELGDASLPARVAGVIDRHRLSRGQLVVELPGSALTGPDGRETGQRLLAAGAALSLSGPGEWPTELVGLTGLPVGNMKLVGAALDGGRGAELAHMLRLGCGPLQMVVERVESTQLLEAARRLEGALVQGFLLAHPAPDRELDALVLHGCPVPT